MTLLLNLVGISIILALGLSAQGTPMQGQGQGGYSTSRYGSPNPNPTPTSSSQLVYSATNPTGGRTQCTADGLNIRCMKSGYEADTLTVRNKMACYDGSHCAAVYYNIAVYYGRCNQVRKNVKNYGNRFLRPHEAYSYYFAKANRNRCLEYVIHTCSMHTSTTRPIDCSSVFDITTY